jgi:hypothetical protein
MHGNRVVAHTSGYTQFLTDGTEYEHRAQQRAKELIGTNRTSLQPSQYGPESVSYGLNDTVFACV